MLNLFSVLQCLSSSMQHSPSAFLAQQVVTIAFAAENHGLEVEVSQQQLNCKPGKLGKIAHLGVAARKSLAFFRL